MICEKSRKQKQAKIDSLKEKLSLTEYQQKIHELNKETNDCYNKLNQIY